MEDSSRPENLPQGSPVTGMSAGGALRHELFNQITPILLSCDFVPDSSTRLRIQACCLDVVTKLEDLIRRYRLDNIEASELEARGKVSEG